MSEATLSQVLNSLAKGIQSQIESHASLLADAENRSVDEFNELFDAHEELQRQHDRNVETARGVVKERDALIEKRREDEKDLKQIMKLVRDIKDSNDMLHAENTRLNNEAKELRALNPKKLKEQVKRLKENAKSHDVVVKKANQEKDKANRECAKYRKEYQELADKHNGLIDVSKRMKEMLFLEGGVCEHTVDDEFYIYRRPNAADTVFKAKDDETQIADKPFYFRVESNTGVHFDVISLVDGDVGYPQCGLDVPKGVGEYCREQFKDFTGEIHPNWKSKVGNDDEIDSLLSKLQSGFNV